MSPEHSTPPTPPEAPKSAETTSATTEPTTTPTVPLTRFNEVIAERNRLREQLEKTKSTQTTTEASSSGGDTQMQKLLDELATLKAQITADKVTGLRIKAAVTAGIPEFFADRLSGETYDDLVADAKKIASLLPTPPASGLPRPTSHTTTTPPPSQNLRDPKWVRENTQKLLQGATQQQ